MTVEVQLLDWRTQDGARQKGQRLVRAEVLGHPALFVVDTGATDTLITSHLARRLALRTEPTEPGRDHAGLAVPTWRCLDPLSLEIGGHCSKFDSIEVVEAPLAFRTRGVEGILAPQRLIEGGFLDLDFRRGCMAVSDTGFLSTEQDLTPLIVEHRPLAGDLAHLIVVEGAFEDSGPLNLMLNSGTWETEVGLDAGPGSSPFTQPRGRGLSGTALKGGARRGRLVVGGVRLPDTEAIMVSQIDPIGGQIGMELLRFTRLQLHRPSGHVRWWIPQAWRADLDAQNVKQ